MTKATPSKGQEHWTSAIKGEAKVNKKKFGIATTTVNPNDPAEMVSATAPQRHSATAPQRHSLHARLTHLLLSTDRLPSLCRPQKRVLEQLR